MKKFIIFFLLAIIIVFIAIFALQSIKGKEEIYFIYSIKTKSESELINQSTKAKLKGGGGNVLHKGNNYYVILTFFEDKKTAEKVCENMSERGEILACKINKKNPLYEIIMQIQRVLYEISNNFDYSVKENIQNDLKNLIEYNLSKEKILQFSSEEQCFLNDIRDKFFYLTFESQSTFSYKIKNLRNSLMFYLIKK